MAVAGAVTTKLYLIEILHQTTTGLTPILFWPSCILSKFYIKPQQPLFLLKVRRCCILSKFYIKPQRLARKRHAQACCILSKFYIKPQLLLSTVGYIRVVSYRNSTSNHNSASATSLATPVVSYRNSTSNHNYVRRNYFERKVVSYRNSTSNHNPRSARWRYSLLYLIEILHQTTTRCKTSNCR